MTDKIAKGVEVRSANVSFLDSTHPLINLCDIVGKDGLTDREKNHKQKHEYPLYSIVEINNTKDNGLRLYVQDHSRDCDGTPLYSLTYDHTLIGKSLEDSASMYYIGKISRNHSEWSLTLVKKADEVKLNLIKNGYMTEEDFKLV